MKKSDAASIFNALQITSLIPELCQDLVGLTYYTCQVLQSNRFLIQFKKEDAFKTIFFNFQTPFIRFHLTDQKQALSVLKFPEHPIQKYFDGAVLKRIEQLNLDRIVKFNLISEKGSFSLLCEFFSKHPNYYILDAQEKILYSLYDVSNTYYQLPPLSQRYQQASFLLKNSQQVEEFYQQKEKDFFFQLEKTRLQKTLIQTLKNLKKKYEKLIKLEKECAKWEIVQHEGELLKASFFQLKKGMTQITLWDWLENREVLLPLNPTQLPQEILQDRFKRAKKLQMGLPHLQKQIHQFAQKIVRQEKLLENLEITTKIEELVIFKSPKNDFQLQTEKAEKKQLPYKEYFSKTQMPIWVGKNARNNDQLTFKLAKGSDWWLHTQDVPGSHVVIRTKKGQIPDDETLADAMQLALVNSKAKDKQEAEICVTQRKYLSRMGKNQPGKVQISKHKTYWIRFNDQRYQAIVKRMSREE
jgi:predicted ribosome quality control (RQC) complex YloA/Tae2 family protein